MYSSFMRSLAVSFAIVMLLGVPLARQSISDSAPKLLRRHHHSDHPPYTAIYLMKNEVDFSSGTLKIFDPDGKLAFNFDKATRTPKRGLSYVSLFNPYNRLLLTLTSHDDVCYFKSHYEEPARFSVANRQFKIDPRGPAADRWKFHFIAPSGEKLNYFFKRNFWNKGGKVYLARGNKHVYVAKLQDEVRWESWLNPGLKGTSTFTLYLTSQAPEIELVTLMGLVLARTDTCGL